MQFRTLILMLGIPFRRHLERPSGRREAPRAALRRITFERLEARYVLDAGSAALLAAAEGESEVHLPDFGLVDVNPASARFQETISPRDYLQQVSAWYFGHAT